MLKISLIVMLFIFTLNANILRVGYSTDSFNELSKKDSQIVLNLWFRDMMQSVEHKAEFTFYDDITLMADDFHAGRLDLIFANGLELVKYFNLSQMQGAFTGTSTGENTDNLVEVRKKSTSIDFLKRQKIVKISLLQGENPSRIYAQSVIAKGYKNSEILSIHTRRNSAALLKLFFNQVDIAIVPKKTFLFAKELNPQIGDKLEIVRSTNISLGTLGYFHKNIDAEFRKTVTDLAFQEVEHERGKQMLVMFKTHKLVKVKLDKLNPIIKLYQEYKIEQGLL